MKIAKKSWNFACDAIDELPIKRIVSASIERETQVANDNHSQGNRTMNKALNGKWILLNANGKVNTLADLDKICELMARSLCDNADCTMTIEKQGPFTLTAWQSYASPHYAEGFDEFCMVPDRWHAKAIAMIRQHIATIGPSHSALALINADRLAEINN